MIPKKIHYCWFGRGEKPKLAQKCIKSWRAYCPDYDIVEWNEDNFDISRHPYLQWCYENKKWAFLSDLVRLLIVFEHGGLYFDTDVELVRSPDELLQYEAFFGFENDVYVNTGEGFGAQAGHVTVGRMIEQYLLLQPSSDGEYAVMACPHHNTRALLPLGLVADGKRQNVCGAEILPADFLNPYDSITGRLLRTANTISIHWYSQSWLGAGKRLRSKLTKPLRRLFGKNCFAWLKRK